MAPDAAELAERPRIPARAQGRASPAAQRAPLVLAEPGGDLCFVVDVLLAGYVDDDFVDGAAGERERCGVFGRHG